MTPARVHVPNIHSRLRAYRAAAELEETAQGERRIWQAVIVRAIKDRLHVSVEGYDQWTAAGLMRRDDFDVMCRVAGWSAERIRRLLREMEVAA